jgi:hypothetical protein
VKKGIWMLSCLLLLSMAGCETESSSPISKPSSSQQQTKEESSQDTADKRSFTLTEAEQKAYESIKRDLDEKHLQGLSPVSIAKIYVQAVLDKEYDVQYALYTDRPDYVLWSKEEDEQIPESDRGTKEQLLQTFSGIEKGEFIQTSDHEGYIKYMNESGEMGFQMVKDEDGIWNVSFTSIQ